MSEIPISASGDDKASASPSGGSYAPYGQLVKMLMPSVGSIAIYGPDGELVWCSDGYERPDLRGLLESLRASDTVAGRGKVESTSAGVPAFVSGLRGTDLRPLGSIVIELSHTQNSRYSGSMVASLLRPVLDCLESRLGFEAAAPQSEPAVPQSEPADAGSFDLLLSIDENDREDSSALERLLRHCVEHLGCVIGAFLVPDKNLAISCTLDDASGGSQLLDRTQKHLLAWAQLNNRPMVVNRVAGASDVAPYKILSCPVRDPHNRVTGLIALFRSASADDFELRDVRILEFVSRKAVGILGSQHDVLTGLENRLIFERRAQGQLDVESPAGHSVLYIDIDKLQAINEAFGFHAGDEVIQRVGDVVRRHAGGEGLASRIGSDRFAILLPRRAAPDAAEVGKRILAAASQLGYVDGAESVPVSVSIGVAAASAPRERIAHLLASAELACKRAKQQGRNRIATHEDASTATLTRNRQLFAATSLQDALKNNDFRLEAQPIVGLRAREGELVGYELLVRMRSPTGELLAPDKFLDAAERYELLPALDRWVMCSTIDALRAQGPSLADLPYCFAVNVSAQSIASGKYSTFVLEQLAQAGLPAAAFCFEIKEAAAVNHLQAAEQFIRELTRAGCKIALDDFGSGLSSLAHLKRLPVQYLKIDGRFVRRVLEDRVAESIVSGIAKAARTLGVSAIAEHVESGPIADRLRELDVEYGQGFYLGRPQAFGKAISQPQPIALRSTVS
jgi:diguanylate cyclase (GGDEF)-like protein